MGGNYHEKFGYLSGPYTHENGPKLQISAYADPVCGILNENNKQCGVKLQNVPKLREHLINIHKANVKPGSSRPTRQEKEWADSVRRQLPTLNKTTNTKPRTILWIAMDDSRQGNIQETDDGSDGVAITSFATDFPLCSPWFKGARVRDLQDILSTRYVYHDSTKRVLHQGVVVMEALMHEHKMEVVYHTSWKNARNWLVRQGEREKTLVFLHYTMASDQRAFTKAYDTLGFECSRMYPLRSEFVWSEAKEYDIRVLDDLAKRKGAFRPKTCFHCLDPGRKMTCIMATPKESRTKIVFKRS
ncbi:hypothetical protein BS50DRAFT_158636, partial [Corynespora cassiicola Philippines]